MQTTSPAGNHCWVLVSQTKGGAGPQGESTRSQPYPLKTLPEERKKDPVGKRRSFPVLCRFSHGVCVGEGGVGIKEVKKKKKKRADANPEFQL